jgi:murein DD-endopeptidase MepM/ murein hydrolase activator NlpD
VTNDISTLIERARQMAAQADASSSAASTPSAADRQKLVRVAQEFESMLLVQVLKDMRKAGKWDDDESDEGGANFGLGAESLFEMADGELARHLSEVSSFGLSSQMLAAFDRMQAGAKSDTTSGLTIAQPPAAPAPPQMPTIELPVAVANVRPGGSGFAETRPTYVGGVPHGGPGEYVSRVPGSGPGENDATAEPGAGEPAVRTVDGHVTSHFGWRRDPITGESRFHSGVDLAAVYGQDVQAAKSGLVVFSGEQRGYGNTVIVQHEDGTRTRYAHLSALLVNQGDRVDGGQPVGRAGHSGRATGTHVHFEVMAADGRRLNPESWIKGA